jgi:hypothetical protein
MLLNSGPRTSITRTVLSAFGLVVGLVAALYADAPQSAPAPRPSRTLRWDPDTPIVDRLLPDVDFVNIENKPLGLITFLPEPQDLSDYIDYSVGFSDAAVTLRVDRITGKLSEGNTWISSEFTVTPTEVLYSNTRKISRGHTITFLDDGGGRLRVGNCLVTAGTPIEVHKGGSYLVFFANDPYEGDGHLLITRNVFAVERSRLVDTWRAIKPPGIRTLLDGLPLRDVRKEIKRAAASKKRE